MSTCHVVQYDKAGYRPTKRGVESRSARLKVRVSPSKRLGEFEQRIDLLFFELRDAFQDDVRFLGDAQRTHLMVEEKSQLLGAQPGLGSSATCGMGMMMVDIIGSINENFPSTLASFRKK